jgi:hypothetical protein
MDWRIFSTMQVFMQSLLVVLRQQLQSHSILACCLFSYHADVEDITQKTGNYKKFSVFVQMLTSALAQRSESVFVDLLTYTDLEMLKARRAGATPIGELVFILHACLTLLRCLLACSNNVAVARHID